MLDLHSDFGKMQSSSGRTARRETMNETNDNETVKVQLSTEETFNAGRAAQVQGVATLGDFARLAMLEAAKKVLEDHAPAEA